MKKMVFILISMIVVIFFSSCTTKLRIANESSFTLDLISWSDENGRVYWFGRDWVYDSVLGFYIEGMYPGSSDEKSVEPGCCPVYFWFASGGPEYQTYEDVIVEKWKNVTFALTDDTDIMSAGINAMSLKEITETLDKTSSEDEYRRLKEYKDM